MEWKTGCFALGFFSVSLLRLELIEAPSPLHFDSGVKIHCLILALGDLQWVGGLSCLSFCPFFLVLFSCPTVLERDPSYPSLADSPSLPTPSWIGRMASRQEGGGWNPFSTFGWSARSPFSRRGLALFFLCVVCFDSLCF